MTLPVMQMMATALHPNQFLILHDLSQVLSERFQQTQKLAKYSSCDETHFR